MACKRAWPGVLHQWLGRRWLSLLWLYATSVALLLTGCRGPARPAPHTATPFLPPTAPATPTVPPPTSTPTPDPNATPPPCTPDLRFVADETIPDGSQVPPGATLIKAWRVRNAGTCPWGPGYTLRFVSGDLLDAKPEQPLFPAAPGEEARLEVHFRAPQEPGMYHSLWQAFTPQEQPFGDPVFIVVEVVTPTATPTPGESTPEP